MGKITVLGVVKSFCTLYKQNIELSPGMSPQGQEAR